MKTTTQSPTATNRPLFVLSVIAGLSLFSSPGFADLVDEEERTLPAQSAKSLVVGAVDSDVVVNIHDSETVRLLIKRQVRRPTGEEAGQVLEHLKTSFEQRGDAISLEEEFPRNGREWKRAIGQSHVSFDATYTLWVPSRFSAQLRSVDGDLRLGNIEGEAHLQTVDGDIVAGTIGGAVHAQTVDGDIRIGSAGAIVRAQTVDGDILIEEAGAVTAQSVDGDILASIARQPSSKTSVTTTDGDVILQLAHDVSATIDARTADGEISVGLELGNVRTNEHSFRGEFNGGGIEISATTMDGEISIRPIRTL